jgi:uncharacterized cupin superfamily protein
VTPPPDPVPEAELRALEHGQRPQGSGWYVINARDAQWSESPHFGSFLNFEGDQRFPEVGVNIHVLQPGQPACKYHSEGVQEGFLVLSGECTLIVEEQERSLVAWDFVHCPPGTRHVFVGAGDGPCAILMFGRRGGDQGLHYPASEVAAKHGASVTADTPDPRVAYAGLRERRDVSAPPPLAR